METLFKSVFHYLEFRKNSIALIPSNEDPDKGVAFSIVQDKNGMRYDFCSCRKNTEGVCKHRKTLASIISELEKINVKKIGDIFRMSVWDMLAGIMNDALKFPREKTRAEKTEAENGMIQTRFFMDNLFTASYTASPDRTAVLLDRLGIESPESHSRYKALDQLNSLTLSENERIMLNKGIKTRRQALENSFWYTFFYHLFFDWQFKDAAIRARINDTGEFFIENINSPEFPCFTLAVLHQNVPHILLALKSSLENIRDFTVSQTPLRSILKMSLTEKKDLRMELWLRFSPDDHEETTYSRRKLLNFTYGDLIYLKDRKCFAQIEKPDILSNKFKGRYSRTISNEKIPMGLDSLGESFWGKKGVNIIDNNLKNLTIFKTYDHLHIESKAVDRNWFYLCMEYGFGKNRISIHDIIKAKKEKKRFIPVDKGWVDVRAVNTDAVYNIQDYNLKEASVTEEAPFKISISDLFRFIASSGKPAKISGAEKEILDNLLNMTPASCPEIIPGLESNLRDYQFKGVQWLVFLMENKLSGILCDDMGLGKTHQVMALMTFLKFIKNEKKPFLVVAPVTVLNHWEAKLGQYTSGLKTIVHHGLERDISNLEGYDVILTSYGVLRRDSFDTIRSGFALAVFDEAQYVKNPKTMVYRAAFSINADMKLCVTGTPVENSLAELKALMDLAIPGYLGSDDYFETRYIKPIMQEKSKNSREELARMVKPFTLRRMKKSVLTELPEKIEDTLFCRLSEEQVSLYRQIITEKGRDVRQMLEHSDNVSYVHVFALFSMLKQICDHPALILKKPSEAKLHESGKWDLFKEILDQALSSGQKIVVYSQYLDMIRIIENHLESQGIRAVSLTGASRKRGELLNRFNNDPECRVFVGSLLAGGVGIDLVSASVVIHYDRWWNAAKEDQATDRVHRIGQRRGVQVFKLVTKGTLEEKISDMIEKKKNLMDSVVLEDDPDLLKSFTREELISLLSMPD